MKELFDECRLLRVVQVVHPGEIKLEGVDRLIHLKYLTTVASDVRVPDGCSLGRLKNLETLDANMMNDISNMGLWTIGTLRHVSVCGHFVHEPPSYTDLKNLQSVNWVTMKEQDQLFSNSNGGCLNNLQNLRVLVKDEKCWDRVGHLLGTLPSLLTLKIHAFLLKLPEAIIYPRALPNYENLQSLYLSGKWPNEVPALKAALLPPRLLSLTLANSKLANDPMPELGMLESLKTLRLIHDVYNGGEELICQSGFPHLQTLELYLTEIKSVTVVEGAMLNLKRLHHSSRIHVQLPPPLQHLSRS